MRSIRPLAGVSALALAATLLTATPPGALAEPASPPSHAEAQGRGVEPNVTTDRPSAARTARAATSAPTGPDAPLEMPASYPFQPRLRVHPPSSPDYTELNGTISYSDLAPRLMDLMDRSDRVSTQVVGQSTGGRDLYLVTVTAPERRRETARQSRWRELIKERPARAAHHRQLKRHYKTPIWFSSNIHGNEWEGTDAAMRVIEDLATAKWSRVGGLLRNHRLYFSLTLNPDGRTNATRATLLGLDANRDMITATTPESRSFVRTAQAIQPLYAADLHGYTGVLQVEPCGPPHGENYEYDLFIPHGYAAALQVERDVVEAAIPGNTYYNVETGEVVPANTGPETAHIKIPYRDTPSGWDDYPPIFTAQYTAYLGAVTSTVELPKGRTGLTTTPENAAINTAVAKRTIESMVDYVADHSDAMLADQIEAFRRGVAGEPKQALTEANIDEVPGPQEWKPLWDAADDQDPVSLPRAYVIPVGEGQRSDSDARRLVDHLLFNEIEVGVLTRATRVGGTRYPAGSYVVDMHQPLRGLANALLDLGSDISQKVPTMYDVSAWSLGRLWGATVDKVGETTDRPIGPTRRIRAVEHRGLPPRPAYLAFDLAGVDDYRTLNALLEEGVEVSMLADGRAVVPPAGWDEAAEAAKRTRVGFSAATPAEIDALDDPGTEELEDLTVAYVGNQDDLLSLAELGFDDLVPVSAEDITTGAPTATTGLEGADVLWVGTALDLPAGSVGRAYLQSWVDAGGSIVGRTDQAFAVASTYGLVSGTAVAGNRSGNGIVAVDTPMGSVLAPYAQENAFVYRAYWFTGLGEGTRVEQSYDAQDPFLAGHWRPSDRGGDGPASAAGQAAAISGEAESGARAFVFGTSVFFRTHPKGGLSQAARALFWAAG